MAGGVPCSRPVLGMGIRDIVEEADLVSGWKREREERDETGLERFEPRWLRNGLCCLRKWDTGGKLVPGTAMSLAGRFELKDVPHDIPVRSFWGLRVRPGMDCGWWGRKAMNGGKKPVGRQWWCVGRRALGLGPLALTLPFSPL